MSNEARFETYPRHRIVATPSSPVGPGYGWRFRAADGQISAVSGEGFTRREDAHRAVSDFLFDCGAPDPSPSTVDLDENDKVIKVRDNPHLPADLRRDAERRLGKGD